MSFVNLQSIYERFNRSGFISKIRRIEERNLLLVTVHKDDGDHFHEGDHNETDGTSEAVEHLQPILSGTGTEDKPHEETHHADNSYNRRIETNISAIQHINNFSTIDCEPHSPVMYCFFILLKRSMSKITHSIPSSIPICEPRPRARSIMKKIQDQKGAPGSSTIACVNTIKASPVPSAAWEYDYVVRLLFRTFPTTI